MIKDNAVDFNEDMTGIVFDGKKYDILNLDMIFYEVYKLGHSEREAIKDDLLRELKKAGIEIPKESEEDFGWAITKKYRKTMQRKAPDY